MNKVFIGLVLMVLGLAFIFTPMGDVVLQTVTGLDAPGPFGPTAQHKQAALIGLGIAIFMILLGLIMTAVGMMNKKES